MRLIRATVIAFTTGLFPPWIRASSTITPQQKPLAAAAAAADAPAIPFEIRDADADDVGDLVDVSIAAFSRAPLWRYIHPLYDDYVDYFRRCTERQLARELDHALASNGSGRVRVLSVPDDESESESASASGRSGCRRVVSFSAWNLNRTGSSGSGTDAFWPLTLGLLSRRPSAHDDYDYDTGYDGDDDDVQGNCSLHLATNMTRAVQVEEAIARGEREYLDGVYGAQQAYLGGLATHPRWDGHGFAAAHLRWGMALADARGLPTTLSATPAGHPVYRSVGFGDVYNITVERLDGGDGEVFWFEVMKYPIPIPG
ncbi:hypothetical protein F4778DRAFT_434564 [Xylariomycetidae sp. FL2044]|nr:hypothetical protein F4778DRAFT_434564 [Xylariomycetidae sp. FL2044]